MELSQIQLSDEQRKIVELTDGHHLVLAPPGTGKTELLAHRVFLCTRKRFQFGGDDLSYLH